MKKDELQQILINDNVPKDLYHLNGGLPNEAFCLSNEDNFWEVYYSERGMKSQLMKFDSEDKACDYFYKLILEFID